MDPDDRWVAGRIVDRHNVKSQWAFLDVTFTQEIMRGAHEHTVLFRGNALFRLAILPSSCARVRTSSNTKVSLSKPMRSISPLARGCVVPRKESMAEAPQVPTRFEE